MKYQVRIGKEQITAEISRSGRGRMQEVRVEHHRHVVDQCAVPGGLSLIVDGRVFDVVLDSGTAHYRQWAAALMSDSASAADRPSQVPTSPGAERVYHAPMPGRIVSVCVKVGDKITPGQVLLTIEAMKMENELKAHSAGTVISVHVQAGVRVTQKAPLLEIG